MLAPRKKLWTTPREVIQHAVQLLQPTENDIVYDIGCGDGPFLIECALNTNARSIVGIEIDEERACVCESNLQSAHIDSNRCKVITQNALEVDFSQGTCFFLYLIPRGLKIILPILQAIPHPIRVVHWAEDGSLRNVVPVAAEDGGM
eukprot:gene30205-36490_t